MGDNVTQIILFRLINFGILLALGYYLFKKYAKNAIDEAITQKEMLLKGLEEQGYFLEGKVHNLDLRLELQERKAMLLKLKIDEWHAAVHAQTIKRQEELKMYAQRVNQQIMQKNKMFAEHVWRKQIMPKVLNRAHDVLAKEYSDMARAKAYNHTLIVYFERAENEY